VAGQYRAAGRRHYRRHFRQKEYPCYSQKSRKTAAADAPEEMTAKRRHSGPETGTSFTSYLCELPAALDALPTFIYVKDRNFRIVSANLPFCQALGLARADLVGQRTDPLLGEDGPLSARIDREVIETGTARLGIVEKYTRPDGVHWVLSDKSPIKDNAGNTVGLIGTSVDITSRKQTEDALTHSESRLRFLTDNMADILWVMDMQLHTTYISPSVERVLGFSPDEWLRRRIEEMGTPETVSRIYAELQRQLTLEAWGDADPNRTLTLRVEYYHKNGSTRWLEQVIRALRDDSGKLIGMIGVARDMTARKRAEDALATSEAQIRFLANHMADMLWTMDLNFHTTFVSPSIERVLGFTPEERARQSLSEMVTPESARRTAAALQHQLTLEAAGTADPNRSVTMQVEYYRKDGSTGWFENVITSIRDGDGRLTGLLGVSREVTQRRQAEEALRQSEGKYRELFEQSVDAISLVSPDGKLIDANPAWFRLFGYTKDDLASFSAHDAYVEPGARARFLQAIGTQDRVEDEVQFKRKDGTVFDCHRTARVRRDAGGSIVGFQTVFHDVTEQKRTLQALRASETRFRQFFDQSVAPISLAAPDGRIIEANDAWFRLFGYSREDLSWLTTYQLYEDPGERDRTIERALAAEPLVDDAARHSRKDGSTIEALRSVSVCRDHNGDVIGYLAVYRDVTELKKAQDEVLSSREQLRELAARMQQVLEHERTAVAHDLHDRIGQGLTALKLDLDALRRRLGPAAADQAAKLDASISMVEDLAAAARDIMTELRPGMLDDLGLCAAVDWQLNEFSRRTGITFEATLLRDDSSIPAGHATALFRVMQELLSNVARHARATRVQVSLERRLGNIILTVSDDGRGISDKDLSSPTSLGLLGIQERLRPLGGDFTVRRSRTRGTIARVRLPATPRLADAPEAPTASV